MPMSPREALEVVAEHRGDRIVIATMSSIAVWPQLSDTPLDFAFIPSAMGQAPALALGLALAQPGRGVVVLNGDGSMLMNLGSLVTLANQPADVYLLTFDNGIYEVTGGQPTAGVLHSRVQRLRRGVRWGLLRVHVREAARAELVLVLRQETAQPLEPPDHDPVGLGRRQDLLAVLQQLEAVVDDDERVPAA